MAQNSNTAVQHKVGTPYVWCTPPRPQYHISKAQKTLLRKAYNAGGALVTPHIARANWAKQKPVTKAQAPAPTTVAQLGQSMTNWGSNPLITGPTYKIRAALATQGITLQAAKAQVTNRQLTQQQLASGTWVKLAKFKTLCKQANIPASTIVYASGQDRGYMPTLALPQGTKASSAGTLSHFTCMYVGRTRYVPSSSVTAGLAQLKSLYAQGGIKAVKAQCTVPPGQ